MRRNMKKGIALFLSAVILTVGLQLPMYGFEMPLRVEIDNELLEFPDAKPFIDENNRTQTPARFIGEALGATVTWDGNVQQAKFVKDQQELIIQIGSKKYQLNGRELTMDTVAVISKNRTFVPARYIAEAFGAEVSWESDIKTVVIKSNQSSVITTSDGTMTYYDGIAFDATTDVNIYGSMDPEKTAEFCMNLAKTISFYKEDGKLYFKGSYPETPDGFRYELFIKVFYKDGSSFAYFDYARNPDAIIAKSGDFTKMTRNQDLSKVDWISINIEVKNGIGYTSGTLLVDSEDTTGDYPKRGIYIYKSGGHNEDYTDKVDFEAIFQW